MEDELVQVTWEDAGFENSCQLPEDAKKLTPLVRHNVGYLVKKDDHETILAFGIINDNEGGTTYDGLLVIPAKMVLRINKYNKPDYVELTPKI